MNKTDMMHSEDKNLPKLPSDAVRVLEVLSGIQGFTRNLASHLVSELKPTMASKVSQSRENDHNNNTNSRG